MKKRFRVTIECEVEARRITRERILAEHEERVQHALECKFCGQFPPGDPPSDESVADQAMLQDELLADPHGLYQWLRHEVAVHLNAMGVEECKPDLREEDILKPIVERLPARQRHRFREALAKGTLIELAEEFFESFNVRTCGVTLEDTPLE